QKADGRVLDHPILATLLIRCRRLQERFDDTLRLVEPWFHTPEYNASMMVDHGLALAAYRAFDQALSRLDAALVADPSDAQAWCHAAAIAVQANELTAALRYVDQALTLAPDLVQATYLRADILDAQGEQEAAFQLYQTAHNDAPWPVISLSTLMMLTRRLIEWPMAAQVDQAILEHWNQAMAGQCRSQLPPFVALVTSDDQTLARQAADMIVAPSIAAYQSRRAQGLTLPPLAPATAADRNRKLRLGYMSSDFNHHAGMHLVASMFQHHDRQHFDVLGLAVGDHSDNSMRQRIASQMDRMVDIHDPSPLEGAQAIRDLNLDILIDLRGFTAESRIHLCLDRPAHLHVTWLGYPGPVAAQVVDYQIVDQFVAPADCQEDFGAALAYMPTTYQMTDNQQTIGEPLSRDAVLPGVTVDHFVFACFCQTYKIQPESFACWMDILAHVPQSVLWLWADTAAAQTNLRAHAEAAGIDPERLVFASGLPKEQHMARVLHADLILDTWRYGGHVTTSDMLWAGVPVLAKQGTHFASRVSQSLLYAAGLPDLVAVDAAAYRDKAVTLAMDPTALHAVRDRVAQARTAHALFDTQGRVQHLEQLYRHMWHRYCAGKAPATITLPADDA
ncbi:MAG: hypothetical protein AAF213_13005, partial [Pseudomonadota bacterium]